MRTLILILTLISFAVPALAQRDYLKMPQPDTVSEPEEADNSYANYYSAGVAAYEKGAYARAETRFRKAFAVFQEEEGARYVYYSLLYQGLDLEAEDFKNANRQYTFAIPPARKGLESVYMDIGPRISANGNAGNIAYGDVGAFCKVSPTSRLWQSFTYLQQDQNLGSFKQFGYFASLSKYLEHGWYITPAFHYDYVPYSFSYQQTNSVSYSASYTDHHDTVLYKTAATQNVNSNLNGRTQFLNVSMAVAKRAGAFTFEAEPAFHYIPGEGTLRSSYVATGSTDSFEHNRLQGTKPFYESGSSSADTSYERVAFQAGIAISYIIPRSRGLSSIRGAIYYGWNDGGGSSFAWQVNAMICRNKNFRFFISYLSKGNLPLSIRNEGQYFNFNDPVKARAAVSFQLHPFRHFSPLITYQFEQDTRLEDAAPLTYHSVYLTLKYNL